MDRPPAQAQAQAHPHSRHYPSHSKPIHYNRVPIGGPDRPPVTQLSSPGTIYASPSGGRESSSSSYPVPSNSSPKRELGSPGIKRESGPRDDSDQAADRSSVVTRRSSTEYPDVCNDELKPEDAVGEPQRKKQKRNKPTLSCFECVERKTKCDRGRPHCLACIKRQTECKYALVANLLEETSRSLSSGRRMTKPPKKKGGLPGDPRSPIPNIADRGVLATNNYLSKAAVALSTGLLSTVPYSLGTGSNVFGVGSAHPFVNVWSCEGQLNEVVAMMPSKLQCDMLISRYFECVDPVYPMLDQRCFLEDYEHFWTLPVEKKYQSDAAFVGLIMVMLALGTQFLQSGLTTTADRADAAEMHASASNQALRMSSYLSTASIRSIQTMVLLVYFLINDNHASDGWAFAGILMRQAYAMGLHRDPNIVTPGASHAQKQERRKVWQAVLHQDTFLTVLLSLPPNATHTDVHVDDMTDEVPGYTAINASISTDLAYIRGSWTLANLVQESICSPRCLDMPICATPRHKTKLVADFRAVYRSFPDTFRSWDGDSLTALALTNGRAARQTLWLTSNYFHNVMLVHASESPDVPVNVRATLEAAHDAINAFFMLHTLFEAEARTWWVFNHRAFLEALCIGSVLRETSGEPGGEDVVNKDQLFVRGRGDIARLVHIMTRMGEGDDGSEVARTRAQVLSEFLDRDEN
ncbi:Zn(II)2Cys6 transcription factor [Diaporthe sp. PMI_573]|nr:Zn(II)2Cys6 transcription factor [Diaporthaceae sp. PMI_573]